jgi:hypothetical protein
VCGTRLGYVSTGRQATALNGRSTGRASHPEGQSQTLQRHCCLLLKLIPNVGRGPEGYSQSVLFLGFKALEKLVRRASTAVEAISTISPPFNQGNGTTVKYVRIRQHCVFFSKGLTSRNFEPRLVAGLSLTAESATRS